MSLMAQIKGTFIKIERFKMNPCPSQKKMKRVRGSNITQYFFHTLSCTEFDPWLIQMKAWWQLEFLHQSLAYNIVVAFVNK